MPFPDADLIPSTDLIPGWDNDATGSRTLPRLRLPLSFNGSSLDSVEQDSDQDVAQCVYAIVATELGTRLEEPRMGITSPLFRQGGADLGEIRSAVAKWEPRARIETTQDLVDSLDLIRVEVSL